MEQYNQILNRKLDNTRNSIDSNIWLHPDSEYIPLEAIHINYSPALIQIKMTTHLTNDTRRLISRQKIVDMVKEGIKTLNTPLADFKVRDTNSISIGKSSVKILTCPGLCSGQIIPLRSSDLNFMVFNGAVFLVESNSKALIPLFVICVEKQYLRYAKQCMILGKPIHPKALKVFQNSNFDTPRGVAPSLRKVYRKYYKETFIKMGVKIEVVDTFDDIFIRHKLPKAQGLGGYKQILETAGKEFFASLREFEKNNQENELNIGF